MTAGSGNEETAFKKANGQTRIWTNGGGQKFYNITLTKLDDKEVVVPSNMWIGTEGNNTWVASNFNPAFTTGADVKFTATGYKTVVVNSNVEAGKMTVTGAAYTFNIQEGATLKAQGLTLSGTGATATLDGSGKYELNSGVDTMGGMAFADTWTGTVKLSNITTQQLDLNNYGTAKSVVEIDGWSKFLKNSNGYVYNPKLRLTGSGMTIQDGYSNFSYEFAGGVVGEGDFRLALPPAPTTKPTSSQVTSPVGPAHTTARGTRPPRSSSTTKPQKWVPPSSRPPASSTLKWAMARLNSPRYLTKR